MDEKLASVHYTQRMGRLQAMFRGSMIRLIFDQTLELRESAASDAAALTLISAGKPFMKFNLNRTDLVRYRYDYGQTRDSK